MKDSQQQKGVIQSDETSKRYIMRDKQFFIDLGQRIAELRQKAGLSQTALASQLDLKQQTLANYELAIRRLPSSSLIPLTKIFEVSLEDLLGVEPTKLKPGPPTKLHKQIEEVSALPRAKQKFISDFLETVLQQA